MFCFYILNSKETSVRRATSKISNEVSNKIKREILEIKMLVQFEAVTAVNIKVTVILHVKFQRF
jgi:hypothetical protein